MNKYPKIIKSKVLSKFPNIFHGVSTKNFGNMRPKVASQRLQVRKNQEILAKALSFKIGNLTRAGLDHTKNIKVISRKNFGKIIPNTDGLITEEADLPIMVTIADCVPIFFYDKKQKVIGIAHAGWRGILKNISGTMVKKLRSKFKSNPTDILVYIGPCIRSCHFEVGKDVYEKFNKVFESSKKVCLAKKNKLYVDLQEANKNQLTKTGILSKNIEVSRYCTYCDKNLFSSYRRDKEKFIAQGAVMGLKKKN